MSIQIEYGDITKYSVDAIVIPANPKPLVGKGVDRQIYHLAGRNRLLEERKSIGEIDFGEAEITYAYDLVNQGVRYLVHAVPPTWDGGNNREKELLNNCYVNALNKAYDMGCKSIAFPLLATGVLKFPEDIAKSIATDACEEFAAKHDIDIFLVLYKKAAKLDTESLDRYLYENDYSELDDEEYYRCEKNWANSPAEYEEHKILELMRKRFNCKKADKELERKFENRKRKQQEQFRKSLSKHNSSMNMMKMVTSIDLSRGFDECEKEKPLIVRFNDVLNKYMDERNIKTDKELCDRSLIHRGTLSKMRSEISNIRRDYLWGLAIGLKLSIEETEVLFNSCDRSIGSAYRLGPKEIRREKLIRYCIEIKFYDVDEINYQLENRGYRLIGNRDTQAS